MRRALSAALAALMLFSPLAAEAKILIVNYRITNDSGPPIQLYSLDASREATLFTQLCDQMGVEYRMVNARGTKTLWARTGTQVWGGGAVGAGGKWTEQFDAVVHLGFLGDGSNALAANNGGAMTCRPDSMLIAGNTSPPLVPQLMVIGNQGIFPNAALDNGGTCSTGTVANTAVVGRIKYFGADPTLTALDDASNDPIAKNPTPPAGGIRTLIGAASGSIVYTAGQDFTAYGARNTACTWCDSIMGPPASQDTMYMWERLMSHISPANGAPVTAAPVVFVIHTNDAFTTLDSITAANTGVRPMPVEKSVVMMMAGLARLDSLTGGNVFTDKSKLPIKLGVTVDGGFAHNTRRHPRGSAVDDSATLKATIDSIVAYNTLSDRPKIKLTLGVNYDSVDAYPNEKAWWSRLGGNIRYSPQSWTNIADTSLAGPNNSFTVARDPLGRFAKRAAFGDTSTYEGADSSTYKLLRGALYKTQTLFGKDFVSGLLMPADDDWSPRNSSFDGTRLADSTIFAIARAGFSAIRVNSGDGDCDPNYLRGNHKGFFNRQMRYTSTVRGTPMKILSYHGYPLGGGAKQSTMMLDSVTTPYHRVKIHSEIYRALGKLVWDGQQDYEMFSYDDHYIQFGGGPTYINYYGVDWNIKDRLNPKQWRGNLVRFAVSDFSGDATRPARLGWVTLKAVANNMAMVNRLAGKTVITIDWPENIEP